MKEIWKDIKGYEGIYQVSNLGNVRSLDRYVRNGQGLRLIKSRLLKLKAYEDYIMVTLSHKNVHKQCCVHRLVAETFINNPNNYPCINHKDCNKLNNNVENLEWCTYQYNNIYGDRLEKTAKTKLENNYKVSDETRQKMRNSHLGHKQSIETRNKMSQSMKNAWRIRKNEFI